MHAQYHLDRAGHQEYVLIMPAGTNPDWKSAEYSTKIKLPLVALPHCKLEIDGRCLVELPDPLFDLVVGGAASSAA